MQKKTKSGNGKGEVHDKNSLRKRVRWRAVYGILNYPENFSVISQLQYGDVR